MRASRAAVLEVGNVPCGRPPSRVQEPNIRAFVRNDPKAVLRLLVGMGSKADVRRAATTRSRFGLFVAANQVYGWSSTGKGGDIMARLWVIALAGAALAYSGTALAQ